MAGIEDFKVVIDEKLNPEPWFKPSGLGLVWYQETPLQLPKPGPLVIYAEPPKAAPSTMDRINIRRLFLMLWDSRRTFPDAKISRRSRRRWRGKGGVWLFDKDLLIAFYDAVKKAHV